MYKAVYGGTTLQGSFIEVGDVLASRGFDMTAAEHIGPHTMKVPHTLAHRLPAKVEKLPAEKPRKHPHILAVEHVYRAAMLGHDSTGLKTRPCGCVHPEGLYCVIPVFYIVHCEHCSAEKHYAHDGPHEAIVDGVVALRWLETVEVEDLDYNAYGPMGDSDGDDS
jgi:hypothetical protein